MALRQLSFLPAWVLTAGAVLLLSATQRRAPAATNEFGFSGPEIFKIDNEFGQLRSADLDGDGLEDLIVINNSRSKINLLYNQSGKTNARPAYLVKREINELPPDARFRIDSVASEKRIASLVVADFNNDRKPDLAYYGEPKELVVQLNQGTNGWSQPKRWPLEDGQIGPNVLAYGDLNGDKLQDLVLLGENNLYLLTQSTNKALAEPEKLPYSGAVKALQILDIDGDGRDDLLLVNWDSPNPFRFRLQNRDGQLGPEMHFALPPIRSYWADDLNNDRKTEVITVAMQSGRAQISTFIQKEASPLTGSLLEGQFQVLPLNKTTKARRGLVWADINHDGYSDFLEAEPESGQLKLYLQEPDGVLAAAKTFPTLSGVTDLAVADWDGNGVPDIFLSSSDESQVGVTSLDNKGRIAFPKIIPVEGKPLVIAAGPIEAKAKPVLAVILDNDGKRTCWIREADGKIKQQKLSESFKSNPSAMSFFDVNQDGQNDLVILIPYEKLKILLTVPDKDFEEIDLAPPGGNADQPWISRADVDGDGKDEMLLAQKNFIRAVVLQKEGPNPANTNRSSWAFFVKEQINGAGSNSRIVGATSLTSGTNRMKTIFLLDAERKALTLCERDSSGTWQATRSLSLPVSSFASLEPISLGATNLNSLGFLGLAEVATMAFRGKVWEFQELDGYESPIKDGHLMDVVSGDLNNDGRKELVFLETAKNYLDIVTFVPPHELVSANRWQVFEERTFRSRRTDMPEPREALIVDVTGDGKNDLVVVVHDRILVYPQE